METRTINVSNVSNSVIKEVYNLNLVSCNRSSGVILESGKKEFHISASDMENIVRTFLPVN